MTAHRYLAAVLGLLALAAPARAELINPVAITADDKEAALKGPEGVACGGKGLVVVADTGNGRLLTYTWRDGRLTGGTPVKVAEATSPARLAIDGRGDVLVLDRRTRRIVRVLAGGKSGGVVELKGAAGPGPVAPVAFKLDAADGLHVLDAAGHRVLVAQPDGRVVREVPLPRGGESFTDLAVDGAGRIVVVDAVASRLWAAEKGATAFKPLGTGLKDRVAFATGLLEDRGRLWLVDGHGHSLVKVSADGTYQGRELGMGWSLGKVYYPAQACSGEDGLLVVADRNNNRVQLFPDAR